MPFPVYDAHNHLQDSRLDPFRAEIIRNSGVRKTVVNGTSERDWEAVVNLALPHSGIIPSVGLHPWESAKRSPNWENILVESVERGRCAIGEIGLDRWMENSDLEDQRRVFTRQLQIAAERNLPASIHCLKACGALLETLKANPLPRCGFLLHSYSGPKEMVPEFVKIGAFFSISGYFAHERKEKQRQVFREVPLERLLVETDAPDILPPEEWNENPLPDHLNSPANITAIYRFAAGLAEVSIERFALQVEENFKRLFGGLCREL